ncbi:hypothetical protein LXT21_43195 [Myxococcus sp. K38C18041901]|uniref:hypothetical protein n=1 Tax=Myxococcus guangdongensis TaxID=2906760 RepID=UPI0020A81792|nr:hypothetical protein [Myxococcus guangdongensis]MCP3065594.1 hypothetical protein [Myxococcus guangdongensis]
MLTDVTVAPEPTLITVVQTGTVMSGRFQGATAVRTFVYASLQHGACDTEEGLSSLSATQTLVWS